MAGVNTPQQGQDITDLVMRELRFQEQMEAQRYIFESLWKEVAERVLPRDDIFLRRGPIPQGEKRTTKQFDSTAAIDLDRATAAFKSNLTPDGSLWHKMVPDLAALKEDRDVKMFCEDLTTTLFSARYSPKANFSTEIGKCWQSMLAFGNWAMFTDEEPGSNLRYKAVHLAELFFAENHQGMIDKVFRKFPMTARQLDQKWPKLSMPAAVSQALKNNPEQEFEILHCIHPRDKIESGRADFRGMPLVSYYIERQSKMLLEESGYNSNPYAVGRYITGSREIYGRGPFVTMLADIKMLDEMNKTVMRAAHRVVAPSILLSDDGALQGFDVRADSLNWGALNSQGQPLAVPFETKAQIQIGLDLMDQKRKSIHDAANLSLFEILVEDRRDMTAYETAARLKEKAALLAPAIGAQQSALGVMIQREIDLLARANQLPPMPEQLLRAGGLVKIEYAGPLTELMRADEAAGILFTLQAIEPLMQLHPEAFDAFDLVEAIRTLAEIKGVPSKIIRTPEMVAAIQQQRSQQQAMQQAVAAAPAITGGIKDMADAHSSMMGAQPQGGEVGQ